MNCKIIHSEQYSLLLSLTMKKPGVWFSNVTRICIYINYQLDALIIIYS